MVVTTAVLMLIYVTFSKKIANQSAWEQCRFDFPSCKQCINCTNALRKAYNALSTQLFYNIIVKPYKQISWWLDLPSSMLHNKHKEITRKLIQNLMKET